MLPEDSTFRGATARRSFTGGIAFNPTIPGGFVNAGEREALGRLTSASPYSSIRISNTSLDHLLLGTAADWVIIRLFFAPVQIGVREAKWAYRNLGATFRESHF